MRAKPKASPATMPTGTFARALDARAVLSQIRTAAAKPALAPYTTLTAPASRWAPTFTADMVGPVPGGRAWGGRHCRVVAAAVPTIADPTATESTARIAKVAPMGGVALPTPGGDG
jgi:hypothetical protein